MTTSIVKYLGELRCESVHSGSGQAILSDAPIDNHGKGQAYSPTDLVANSLATCMITTLGIYSKNNQIVFNGATAQVLKIMSKELPRRIVEIKIDLEIKDNRYDRKSKTILERVARNCPVALSLSKEIKQNITINFV
jgi:uncharacterized OsmC-like protein